jgi:tRNA(fMet)-specific endonuclease VapC
VSGRYLLDTSIVVALLRGDPAIEERLRADTEVFLPAVVLGELHFGAAHSDRSEANAARIDTFAATCTVIAIDEAIARH